jgi:hypothetical protein
MIGIRMSPDKRIEIEQWASTQEDKPSLSESIRRLVDLGLAAARETAKAAAEPASEPKRPRPTSAPPKKARPRRASPTGTG